MDNVWEVLAALSALIWGISWTNVALMVGMGCVIAILWRLNSGTSKFDVQDLFLDDVTNKASGTKLIVYVMAGLSVWAVVNLALRDKPIETLLLGVLGIFVGGKVVTAVWGQAPQDTSSTTTTTQTAITPTVDPPVTVQPTTRGKK